MRLIAAMLALLYPITSTEAEIKLELWQTFGAPCTLQSDYINGKCYTPEVKRRPVWR